MARRLLKHQVDEFRAKVAYLRDVKRMSYQAIGALYERDHSTIICHYKQYKKAHGEEIPPPPRANQHTEKLDTIRDMTSKGYTLECIANATGLSTSTVNNIRQRHGIKTVRRPYSARPKYVGEVQAKGKYDELFLEPINQGKTYEEYCQQFGIKAPKQEETAH